MVNKLKKHLEEKHSGLCCAIVAEVIGAAIVIGFAVAMASIICAAVQEAK